MRGSKAVGVIGRAVHIDGYRAPANALHQRRGRVAATAAWSRGPGGCGDEILGR